MNDRNFMEAVLPILRDIQADLKAMRADVAKAVATKQAKETLSAPVLECGCHCKGGCVDPYAACGQACDEHRGF